MKIVREQLNNLEAASSNGRSAPDAVWLGHNEHVVYDPRLGKGAWKTIRRYVLERDRYTCQIQGRKCTTGATCVDHIVPPDRRRGLLRPHQPASRMQSLQRRRRSRDQQPEQTPPGTRA